MSKDWNEVIAYGLAAEKWFELGREESMWEALFFWAEAVQS